MQYGASGHCSITEAFIAESHNANVVCYRHGEGFVSPPRETHSVRCQLGVVQELRRTPWTDIRNPSVTGETTSRCERVASGEHIDLRR